MTKNFKVFRAWRDSVVMATMYVVLLDIMEYFHGGKHVCMYKHAVTCMTMHVSGGIYQVW